MVNVGSVHNEFKFFSVYGTRGTAKVLGSNLKEPTFFQTGNILFQKEENNWLVLSV